MPTCDSMPDAVLVSRPLRRRTFLAGIAGTAATAILAACGSSSATDTPPPVATRAATSGAAATTVPTTPASAATTTPATTTATVAPTVAASSGGKATQITLIHWYPGDAHPIAQVIKAYNDKQSAVKVVPQIETDYTAILQKVQAGLAAGNPPAVGTVGWNLKLFAASALNLVPMEEIGGETLKDVLGRFRPEFLSSAQVGGKTIGLPYATSNPVVYINTDITTAAGLDATNPPKTWNEMVTWAKTIKEKTGKNPLALESTSWLEEAYIASAGGRLLDDKGKPAFDTPEAIAGITAQKKAFDGGLSPYQQSNDASASFEAGTSAIHLDSIFRLGAHRATLKGDFVVTPFPVVVAGKPTQLPTGGNFLGVYARDKDQRKAAWEFLKFVSSEEGEKIWIQTGYMNPTKWKVDVLPGQEAAYSQLADGLTTETIWPGPKGLEALKVYNDWIQKWISGTPVDDSIKQAKTDIATLLP